MGDHKRLNLLLRTMNCLEFALRLRLSWDRRRVCTVLYAHRAIVQVKRYTRADPLQRHVSAPCARTHSATYDTRVGLQSERLMHDVTINDR